MQFLMFAQQLCSCHKKSSLVYNLVDESMTSKMSKAFIKQLDVVAAGWDPEPCCWLRQSCVLKS